MPEESNFENVFILNQAEPSITVDNKKFPIEYGEWVEEDGFRYRTYKYGGVAPEYSDGADIEIIRHTPIQAFVARRNGDKSFYWEQPLEGALTLLYLTTSGEVVTENFYGNQLGKKMATIQPGMVMCWFNRNTDGSISRVQESEYPGFDKDDLPTVPYRASKFNGIEIPIEFWDQFDELELKNKLNAPREFDENGKYTDEYIHWWAKLTKTDITNAGFQRALNGGYLSLEIYNLRSEIQDVIGNSIDAITKMQVVTWNLNEDKLDIVARLKKKLEIAIINGGVSREKVADFIKLADENFWDMEFVIRLQKQWYQISKPEDQNTL